MIYSKQLNLMHLATTSWLFCISLSSFYFYNFNVALPPAVAAIFSLAATPILLKSKVISEIIKTKWAAFFFLYLTTFGIVLTIDAEASYINRIIATPLFLSVALTAFYHLINNSQRFASSIKIVIIIHLIAFYVQMISYYSGIGYIDYLYSITGEEQRTLGGNYGIESLGGLFLRPSGLYNEPGTYSTAIMLLFLLLERINKSLPRESALNLNVLRIGVLLSVLCSFSVFGFAFLLIYAANSARENKKFFYALIALLIFAAPFIYEIYLFPRFFSGQYEESGLVFRAAVVFNYLEIVANDLHRILFGFGFYSDLSEWFGDYVINDLGTIFSILLQCGIFGLLLFLLCLIGGRGLSKKNIALVFVFALCKISMTTMLFWVVFASISLVNHSKLFSQTK